MLIKYKDQLYKRIDATEQELTKLAGDIRPLNKHLSELATASSNLSTLVRSFYLMLEHPNASPKMHKDSFEKCEVSFREVELAYKDAVRAFEDIKKLAGHLIR